MYMVGCDDTIGGYCNGFAKHTAQVIDNQCYLTSGFVSHGKAGSDDDGVGFNCNVHVQYIANGRNITCPVYRSDSDGCSPLVDTWTQVKKCTKLNNQDYPLGKKFTIYVNKIDRRCETHHYVQKYAIVGFVFLLMGGLLIIGILIVNQIAEMRTQTNNTPVLAESMTISTKTYQSINSIELVV